MIAPPDLTGHADRAGVDWLIARSSLDGQTGPIAHIGLPDGTDPSVVRSRVASVTKPIVASAVLLACREHAETLDLPVVEHFPELADRWRMDRRITLGHLLGHSSGMAPTLDEDDATQAAFGAGDDALAGDWRDFHACLLIVPERRFAAAVIAHGAETTTPVRDVALAELERWTGIKRD